MGRNKKSRQTSDFPKPNRKPGKRIQKTNVTNITFKAKPLVILQQLADKDPAEQVTFSGQTLQDVLEKLNHPGEAVVIQGLDKLIVLFLKRPEIVTNNLSKVIAGVGRLIGYEQFINDQFKTKLSKVLCQICRLPENIFMPYSNIFCSQIVFGLTNKKIGMRLLSLKCINQLLVSQKKSVSKNREIFKAFLRFLACDCVVGKQTGEIFTQAYNLTLQFVSTFVVKDAGKSEEKCLTFKIHGDTCDVIDETPEIIDPFELKVCGLGNESDSPVASVQGICTLFDAIFAFLARILALENFPGMDNGTIFGILNQLYNILQNYLKKNVIKPGVYGPKLVVLADKSKFVDAVTNKKDPEIALWLQKLYSS